jgi:hypothetical protein
VPRLGMSGVIPLLPYIPSRYVERLYLLATIYRANTKHSMISSSYKIKTYWDILINMGVQIN